MNTPSHTLKIGSLEILSLIRGSRPRKIATQLLQHNEIRTIRARSCIHTGQRRLPLTIAVAIPDIPRRILLSEDSVLYLAEIFELPEWRHLLNVSLNYTKHLVASNSITEMHPYGVPFC